MKQENRLCLWCQYLSQEAGQMLSEVTWDSGEIKCNKNHWADIIGDDPLNDVDTDLYIKFQTAKNCQDFQLNDNLVEIVK